MGGDGFAGRMDYGPPGQGIDRRPAASVPSLPRGNVFIARLRVRAIRKLYEEYRRLAEEDGALENALGDRSYAALYRQRAERLLANAEEVHERDAKLRVAQLIEAAEKLAEAEHSQELRKMEREWERKEARAKHAARMAGKEEPPAAAAQAEPRAGASAGAAPAEPQPSQAEREKKADMLRDLDETIRDILKGRSEGDLPPFEREMVERLRAMRQGYA